MAHGQPVSRQKGHNMKIHEIALNKAINILQSLNCEFAIIDAQGNKHGNLLITEQTKTRGKNIYPYREAVNFCGQYLCHLQIGQVAQLPYEKYGANKVQSWVGSYMHRAYGKESYSTHINKETNFVEVLRIK
jgi:hypothetical protein